MKFAEWWVALDVLTRARSTVAIKPVHRWGCERMHTLCGQTPLSDVASTVSSSNSRASYRERYNCILVWYMISFLI